MNDPSNAADAKKPTIEESLAAIRAAGGSAWDNIVDPDQYIREMRGYPLSQTCPACGTRRRDSLCPQCDRPQPAAPTPQAEQRGDEIAELMRSAKSCLAGVVDEYPLSVSFVTNILDRLAALARQSVTLAEKLRILKLIDGLRSDEGSAVTICCDNADFNGLPNCCIEVLAQWTNWEPKQFRADTLVAALEAAARAYNYCSDCGLT